MDSSTVIFGRLIQSRHTWREDISLQVLKKYVWKGLQKKEMLNFLQRDKHVHGVYQPLTGGCSTYILHRQNLKNTVTLEIVNDAITKELDGLGQLLEYCAMYKKENTTGLWTILQIALLIMKLLYFLLTESGECHTHCLLCPCLLLPPCWENVCISSVGYSK